MYTLLFIRRKLISNFARVHNQAGNAGGGQDVVQRRQVAVLKMVIDLASELVTTFTAGVAHPLAILVFDIHGSSTRVLVFNAIILPFIVTTYTVITIIRFRVLRAKQRALKSASTQVPKRDGVSLRTMSSISQKKSALQCPSSVV